jgi:peptidoglycan/LPS O-acetylase OafA/YrhL
MHAIHVNPRLRRFAVVSLVYLGLSILWIYGVLDQGWFEGSDVRVWSALAVVGGAHVAFGYVARDWPVLLLPVVVLLLAFPAGYPESRFSEPGPVWFGQLVVLPAEVVLIAAGMGLHALVERRKTAARSS